MIEIGYRQRNGIRPQKHTLRKIQRHPQSWPAPRSVSPSMPQVGRRSVVDSEGISLILRK